ncbi:hypothetical protein BGW80DRAFT_1262208 [Lactifluus volemus]|nr:hypothetical protein BGW80DRAFT_1262208 [Lactifluus volemus]
MDTLEPQVQDSVISNGTTEATTASPPASPPPVLPSAPLPDLSKSAEQTKDGSTVSNTLPIGTSAPLKKFSPVNINRRFMEKISPTPGATQIPPSSASSKIVGTTAKSPPPPTTSHSRLVTTKLTKLPSSSTGTGPGWTRPSSTTPSLAPSPVSGVVSSAPPPAPAPLPHGPPQLPHAGKVIQPQPRGATQIPSTSKSETINSSSKQAGGMSNQVGLPGHHQGYRASRLNGIQEKRQPISVPVAPSPTTTEADTFRGVHLDPNAHHWDELAAFCRAFVEYSSTYWPTGWPIDFLELVAITSGSIARAFQRAFQ